MSAALTECPHSWCWRCWSSRSPTCSAGAAPPPAGDSCSLRGSRLGVATAGDTASTFIFRPKSKKTHMPGRLGTSIGRWCVCVSVCLRVWMAVCLYMFLTGVPPSPDDSRPTAVSSIVHRRWIQKMNGWMNEWLNEWIALPASCWPFTAALATQCFNFCVSKQHYPPIFRPKVIKTIQLHPNWAQDGETRVQVTLVGPALILLCSMKKLSLTIISTLIWFSLLQTDSVQYLCKVRRASLLTYLWNVSAGWILVHPGALSLHIVGQQFVN